MCIRDRSYGDGADHSLPEAAFPGAVRTDSDGPGGGRAVSWGQYIPAAAVPHNYGRDLQPFYGNGFQVQDGAFSGYADRYREKRKRTERDGG